MKPFIKLFMFNFGSRCRNFPVLLPSNAGAYSNQCWPVQCNSFQDLYHQTGHQSFKARRKYQTYK